MTRGFVTLATGNEKYYEMALSMLRSFKVHNPDAKMAVLCDRKNKYTGEFDDVIILDDVQGNYKDKFRLLIDLPYDENIFIEPDCLIYRSLDFFWDVLSSEHDFSAFGWNSTPIDAWFKTEKARTQIQKYLPEISSFPLFNPGYFFIRRSEKTQKMYQDCIDMAEQIINDPILSEDSVLFCKGKLRDDPILSLAMEKNGFLCTAKPRVGKCMSLPSGYTIDLIDFRNGRLDVTDKNGEQFKDCSLLHFSTRKADEEGLYLWQKTVVNSVYKNKSKLIIKILESKPSEIFFSAFRFIKRKIKHLFEKIF